MAYSKHTWQSGEVITDEALNNMENAIAELDAAKNTKQAAIADAAGSDEKEKINAILAALRSAGVIAAE